MNGPLAKLIGKAGMSLGKYPPKVIFLILLGIGVSISILGYLIFS